MKEALNQFRKETGKTISFSKFSSLRPKTVQHNKLRACKCEYCSNVQLKVEAINKMLCRYGNQNKLLGSKFQVAGRTCCQAHPRRHLHSKRCIDRKCDDCGVSAVRSHLQETLDQHADKKSTWIAWERIQ